MIVCDTPAQIQMFGLLSLKAALKMEIFGMTRRGMSASAQTKQLLGVKTRDKKQLLVQLEDYIETLKAE